MRDLVGVGTHAGKREHRSVPAVAAVTFKGVPYMLDLHRCRRALILGEVEVEFDGLTEVAAKAGMSRSTASRFFSGRRTSLWAALRVLAVLRLDFTDVARPAEKDDEP
jgi:hypothetical protein